MVFELGAILGDGPVGQLAAGWPADTRFWYHGPEMVRNGVSFDSVLIFLIISFKFIRNSKICQK